VIDDLRKVQPLKNRLAPFLERRSLVDAVGEFQVISPGLIFIRFEFLEDTRAGEPWD
jgi:hypothetical protein